MTAKPITLQQEREIIQIAKTAARIAAREAIGAASLTRRTGQLVVQQGDKLKDRVREATQEAIQGLGSFLSFHSDIEWLTPMVEGTVPERTVPFDLVEYFKFYNPNRHGVHVAADFVSKMFGSSPAVVARSPERGCVGFKENARRPYSERDLLQELPKPALTSPEDLAWLLMTQPYGQEGPLNLLWNLFFVPNYEGEVFAWHVEGDKRQQQWGLWGHPYEPMRSVGHPYRGIAFARVL